MLPGTAFSFRQNFCNAKFNCMKRNLLPLLLCLLVQAMCLTTYAQGWQKKYSPDKAIMMNALFQKADGTFFIAGSDFSNPGSTRFLKIAADGNVMQVADFDSIGSYAYSNITQDGGYVIIGGAITDSSTRRQVRMLRLNSAGQKVWLREVHTYGLAPAPQSAIQGNMEIDTTDDGGFVCVFNPYDSLLDRTLLMVKRLSANGDVLWQHSYYDTSATKYGYRITNAKDGGFLVQGAGFGNGPYIFKIDGQGNFIWQYTNPSNFLKVAADKSILVYGGDANTGVTYLRKLNPQGLQQWQRTYSFSADLPVFASLVEVSPDTLMALCIKSSTSNSNLLKFTLVKLDTLGNILFQKPVSTSNLGNGLNLSLTDKAFLKTNDGGFAFGGWISNNGNMSGSNSPNPYSAYVIKMDAGGNVYPNSVSGFAFADTTTTCVRTGAELYIRGSMLSFTNNTDTFLVLTGDSGYYALGLDTGLYNISASPVSPYWQAQPCNTTQLNLPFGADTSVSFGFKALVEFPYITMDGQARQRVCNPATYYFEYCNTGTQPFSGFVQVGFDSMMQIDSSSVPWSAQVGSNVLFVQSPPLGIGDCRKIEIYYTVPCDLDLVGRTTCINVHAYDDTVVISPPQWDQSDLQMSVVYNQAEDSVVFNLKNIGNGSMNNPQDLIVIEDNVILMSTPIQLPAGAVYTIKQKANGATWRATVPQTPFNPYSSFTTAAIEAAGANGPGTFSTGFINQFPINGFYGFDYNTCSPIRNSYDPNHKSVFPEGAGAQHLVDSNTMLEYLLEFQNTGTDTAYIVRLVDDLPAYVDPATIRPGVSSHPYQFHFLDNNTIEFVFENINLPDSSGNNIRSNGFVKFRIKQRAGNTNGTVINNTAAIYFDYNNPVITNMATVRIGRLAFTAIETIGDNKQIQISAYPNPFTGQAIIKAEGGTFSKLQLVIYDVAGRMVKQQYVSGTNQFLIDNNGLSNGTYIFEIKGDNQTVGRGKIVSQ